MRAVCRAPSSPCCLIATVVYMERLRKTELHALLHADGWQVTLLTLLVVAAKVWDSTIRSLTPTSASIRPRASPPLPTPPVAPAPPAAAGQRLSRQRLRAAHPPDARLLHQHLAGAVRTLLSDAVGLHRWPRDRLRQPRQLNRLQRELRLKRPAPPRPSSGRRAPALGGGPPAARPTATADADAAGRPAAANGGTATQLRTVRLAAAATHAADAASGRAVDGDGGDNARSQQQKPWQGMRRELRRTHDGVLHEPVELLMEGVVHIGLEAAA